MRVDDIYALDKLDILGMDVCPQACLSYSRHASIHCSNGIPYPHWCRSTLVDPVGISRTFCRLCSEIVHNASTEVLGSENQLVSTVD